MSIFLLQNQPPKTLKHRFMSSQIQWGISLIVLPLLSERVGERLLRVCFRLYEIPLQIIRHYCSQISSLSLKTAFVTYRESVSYKEACKRCPFALQNMPFYASKDALLHCKRSSFTLQKGVDGKRKGKEIYKNNPRNAASPSPSRGRGCAWRDTECWGLGRWKEEDLKLKVHGLILKGQMFRGQKYALPHTDRLSLNS